MNQKELAKRMDMTPVQVRKVIAKLRKKGYPVTAQRGMALCYDEEIVRKEAQELLNHANAELAAAGSLIQTLLGGEPDTKLTAEEQLLLMNLKVIEKKDTTISSEAAFPYINVG